MKIWVNSQLDPWYPEFEQEADSQIWKNFWIRIQRFWNRSGVGVWKSYSGRLCQTVDSRNDNYPVFRLDIRQHSESATGYGYLKTTFKREPDTDKDVRNAFLNISRIQTLGKSCTLHNHSFRIFGSIYSAEMSGLSNFAIQIQSWSFKTQSKSNHNPKNFSNAKSKSKWSPKYLKNATFSQHKCRISFPLTQSKSGPVPKFWRDLQSGSNPSPVLISAIQIFSIFWSPD